MRVFSRSRAAPEQCVRILSAVVPNDLSFELNQCLRNGVLSLQKGHALACTEPFRIPLAGNVSKRDRDREGGRCREEGGEKMLGEKKRGPDGQGNRKIKKRQI